MKNESTLTVKIVTLVALLLCFVGLMAQQYTTGTTTPTAGAAIVGPATGGASPSGNSNMVKVDTNGSLWNQPAAGALDNITNTGTITAACGAINSCAGGTTVQAALSGYQGASVYFTTYAGGAGTINFDFSIDGGTTWKNEYAACATGGLTQQITANDTCIFAVIGGMSHIRVRASAFATNIVAIIRLTTAPSCSPAGMTGASASCIAFSAGANGTNQFLLTAIPTTNINADGFQASAPNGGTSSALMGESVYNGAGANGWVRHYAASLANFPTSQTSTARNLVGAALFDKAPNWVNFSNPAAGSQATISIAAEAGVRHVADCIAFAAGSTAAPALTALDVNLRDGATGAGTILWSYQVVISNATGQNVAPQHICGLAAVGTTNTAMTFEFSAGLANLIESVSLAVHNVN